MKTLMQQLGAVFVVAGLAACGTTPASLMEKGHEPLTGTELSGIFSDGEKMAWNVPGGGSGTTAYKPDGTAILNWGEGDNEGSWSVRGDTLCTRYEVVNDGERRCLTVFRVDGKYHFFNGDELIATARSKE